MGILDKFKKQKHTDVPAQGTGFEANKQSQADRKAQADARKISAQKTAQTKKTAEPAKKKKEGSAQRPATGSASRHQAYKTLMHPLVSEKATEGERAHQYTFVVAVSSTKRQIKDAIETVYGVRPVKIRTVNVQGKRTRFGAVRGRRADWKKAVAILPKGKTISIHEGV